MMVLPYADPMGFVMLGVLAVFMVYMVRLTTRDRAAGWYNQKEPLRALTSVLVGSLVIIAVYVLTYIPLAGISVGGPLLVIAIAYAAGFQVVRMIWPATKDSLAVWLLLLAVALAVSYTYISRYPGSPPPGASRGGPNIDPPSPLSPVPRP
jgi:hypothetical protein